MAKSSIHIEPVKSTSESHNLRLRKFDYVKEDLTHKNFNWGFDQVKLSERKKEIESLYLEKVGRKVQDKMEPLREGVFLFSEEHTNEQILNVVLGIEKEFGIKPIQLSIHRDEGHEDKESGIWKPNLHGHIVFDWQNKETGKMYRLKQDDLSRLQDYFAEKLGMERGKKSTRAHKKALDYKIEILQEQLKIKEEVKQAIEKDDLGDLRVKNPSIFNRNNIDVQMTVENYENALKGLKIEILDLKKEIEKIKADNKRLETDKLIEKNESAQLVELLKEKDDKMKKAEKYIEELKQSLAFPEMISDKGREIILQWRNEFIEKDKKNQDARAKWEADKKRAEQEEIERQERRKNRGFSL